MLLNLSNHPYASWSKEQQERATLDYQRVTDLPFPNVRPDLSSEELDALVEEYIEKIFALNPAAVHIMGEMNFTFRTVSQLEAKGILCLASTTERITTIENNVRTSHFKFVQFRIY